MNQETTFYATGKRKSAVARTWLAAGNGTVTVNDRPIDDYFSLETSRAMLLQPLLITNTMGQYDIKVRVHGGGINGQAGAVRHGITKALILANADFRLPLKKAGFVKRDPRTKERKKYGQRGARARFQFSKR